MPFIKTGKSSYTALDYDYRMLFESENYSDLFSFVYKDLKPLQKAVQEYAECVIDTEKFKVKNAADYVRQHYFNEVYNELIKIHPFYKGMYFYPNNLAMDYVNDLLTPFPFDTSEATLKSRDYALRILNNYKEYADIVWAFIATEHKDFEPVDAKFCNLLITPETCWEKLEKNNAFLHASRPPKPIPACELLYAQRTLLQLFYWVLDLGNTLVSDLSFAHRYALWDKLFSFYLFPVIESTITKISGYDPNGDEDTSESKLHQALFSGHNKEPVLDNGILKEFLAIKKSIKKEAEYFPATYNVNYILDLFMLEFEMLVREDLKLRRCRHCGRYFIIKNLKNFYCSSIADGETEPCDVIGSDRSYRKHLKNNPVLDFYRQMYQTRRQRMNRRNENIASFDVWEKKAQTLRDKALSDEISFDVFKEELSTITHLKKQK